MGSGALGRSRTPSNCICIVLHSPWECPGKGAYMGAKVKCYPHTTGNAIVRGREPRNASQPLKIAFRNAILRGREAPSGSQPLKNALPVVWR